MPILIPAFPQGTQTTLTLQSNSLDLTPVMGGPTQRVARLGDRYVLEVQMRNMSYTDAASIIGKLIQGLSNEVVVSVPQPGLVGGATGSGTASSGGGTALSVSVSGTPIVGQVFSIVKGTKRSLHTVTSASGGSLSIYPMLKFPIAGGETVEFGDPKIQGFLQGNSQSWTVNLARAVGLTFAVIEV